MPLDIIQEYRAERAKTYAVLLDTAATLMRCSKTFGSDQFRQIAVQCLATADMLPATPTPPRDTSGGGKTS